MALDNLREDRTMILQRKDEWIKTCEQEISRLQGEVEKVQKKRQSSKPKPLKQRQRSPGSRGGSMNFKHNFKISLFLMTLIGSLMIFAGSVFAQSVSIDIDLPDLKEVDKRLQEWEILKQMNAEKDKTITELEKSLTLERHTNELNAREIELQKRMLDIKDQEIAATHRALEDMSKVADQSIELAKVSKPKTNWELQGLLGLTAFVVGFLAGR